MSHDETVHTSTTGGQKAGNLERYDLIPAEPLRRLAIHAGTALHVGTGSFHRMMAHAWSFWGGEEVDFATDWVHLIAAAWEAFRIVDPARPPEWVLDDRRPGPERYDRIPADALRQLAYHFGVGAKKYADDNWRRGYDWRLTFAAANRHAWQWFAGETHDPETGSHHLIAFAWHMLVLDEFTRIHPQFDTRSQGAVMHTTTPPAEQLCAPEPLADWELELLAAATAPQWRPRVATSLGYAERDAEWTGPLGHYRYDTERGRWTRRTENNDYWFPTICTSRQFGPYTEAEADRKPRQVQSLGTAERDAEWTDSDGDRYRWNPESDFGEGAWQRQVPPSIGWDDTLCHDDTDYAPFIEVINDDR